MWTQSEQELRQIDILVSPGNSLMTRRSPGTKPRWILPLAVLAVCSAANGGPRVVRVTVDHVVHPITVEVVSRAIASATEERAELVLVRLNTPGGLLDATREIIQKVITSPVPVAMFVTPGGGRAASAGFFLLESGDVAAMAEGTNTGAASPVLLGQQMEPVMRKKVENDTAAWLRSIVTHRARNVEMAEQTIREARSFTESEALKNGLIDLVVKDESELLARLDGREITRFDGTKYTLHLKGAEVKDLEETRRERIITAISDPNVAAVLTIVGIMGIYAEFNAPGLIFPGVIGGISMLLGLSALSLFPVNWAGAALLALALALFVLEAKFHSHGILTAGGAAAMVLGLVLLIDGPPEMRIRLSTAISLTVPFAGITAFLMTLAVRARRNKVITGDSSLIDRLGVARTALEPAGMVFLNGEYWEAVSSRPVPAGAAVRVRRVRGLTVDVDPE
jgi:membrane-bound serine protease (ClpP class)